MAEKLAEYRAKRNFAATPEPSDRAAGPAHRRPIFVVQKHEARRLHYDFRLEIDGELKSWAVTRGPSWDPADKRLAVQVEDHPLAYAEFEGVIPPGQYGGGTVMLWDRGHWRPQGDVAAGLAAGKLGLWLEGERLRGGWTLIRMAGRGRRDNWLLVKDRDEAAEPGRSAEDEGDAATSVKTGRRMAEIAGKAPLRPASPAKPASAKPAKPAKPQPDAAAGAALPDFVAPQLATLVEAPPEGPGWLHEVKLDGYRALLRLDRGRATLLTRRNQDWTVRFRSIAEAAAGLPAETALLDGEVVATDRHGVTSFAALQDALSRGDLEALGYTAFDLIHLDGRDIGALPLVERKAALKALIEGQPGGAGRIAYSEHFEGGGPQALDRACRLALEGTVSKRGDQPYRPGRGADWLKSKCLERQEFVIGGYTEAKGGTRGLGALLLGVWQGEDFVYAGKVGTGFNAEAGRALLARLQGLERAEAAFAHVPSAGRRGAHWVAPNLVCEIEFLAWTEDGLLRHPSFQGLREDKPAEAVVRERPADIPAPAARRRSAAPAAARPDGAVAVAGARLTSPDKVLWPEAGLTKRGLAEYYEAVAGLMLPHIAGRALSVIRCPAGRTKACFFQRHAASGLPAGVRGVPLAGENGAVKPHLVVEDVIGLVGLVQIGVLEVHPWGSRAEDAEHPDRMVFDLDPAPDVPWERVREAALMVRDRLDGLGLRSFCKTTGGKGLHVVVPLRPERPWPDLHAFAKAFAARLEAEAPDRFLDTAAKGERGGRIYLDWLRNERGASAVAPYSTRAKPGAPVATPLAWDEVPALEAGRFDVARVLERVRAKGFQDPWVGFDAVDQALNDDLLRAVAAE